MWWLELEHINTTEQRSQPGSWCRPSDQSATATLPEAHARPPRRDGQGMPILVPLLACVLITSTVLVVPVACCLASALDAPQGYEWQYVRRTQKKKLIFS